MNKTITTWALCAAALMGGLTVGHALDLTFGRGSIDLRHHEVRIFARGRPSADILRNGDLVIGGHAVALGEAQRALTLSYYHDVHMLAASGEAVGKAGGWMALKVIGSLFSALWHGNSAIVNRTAHSQRMHLQTKLNDLCARMSALRAVQDRLAAAQPAFAPYAYVLRSDVEQCLRGARESSH